MPSKAHFSAQSAALVQILESHVGGVPEMQFLYWFGLASWSQRQFASIVTAFVLVWQPPDLVQVPTVILGCSSFLYFPNCCAAAEPSRSSTRDRANKGIDQTPAPGIAAGPRGVQRSGSVA